MGLDNKTEVHQMLDSQAPCGGSDRSERIAVDQFIIVVVVSRLEPLAFQPRRFQNLCRKMPEGKFVVEHNFFLLPPMMRAKIF
jgi:hypothetical protein